MSIIVFGSIPCYKADFFLFLRGYLNVHLQANMFQAFRKSSRVKISTACNFHSSVCI